MPTYLYSLANLTLKGCCLRCVLQELDVSQGYPNTNLKAPAGLRISVFS